MTGRSLGINTAHNLHRSCAIPDIERKIAKKEIGSRCFAWSGGSSIRFAGKCEALNSTTSGGGSPGYSLDLF